MTSNFSGAQEAVKFGCGYVRGRCDCKKCLAAINAAAQEGK